MKMIVLCALIVVTSALVMAGVLRRPTAVVAEHSAAQATAGGAPSPVGEPAAPAAAPRAPASAWRRPDPPPQLAGFYADQGRAQLGLITELETDPRLPAEVVRFLRAAIEDRTLEDVTRNNMANCLRIQADHDAGLAALFTRMTDDAAESPTWREYAVQHLAGAAAFAADPRAAIDALWRLAEHGAGSIPGTALLQLDLLEQQGATTLDDRYSALLARTAANESAGAAARMAALGLIGQRDAQAALGAVRKCAGSGDPSLRRVAIATLGLAGNQGDRPLITAAMSDRDPAVSAAAAVAIANIHER